MFVYELIASLDIISSLTVLGHDFAQYDDNILILVTNPLHDTVDFFVHLKKIVVKYFLSSGD